jgi:predicted phosphohydrolase
LINGKQKHIGGGSLSINRKPAFILFHQGWTDIFNCLALVTYYSAIYKDLTLIIRKDAFLIAKFYVGNLSVNIDPIDKDKLDNDPINVLPSSKNIVRLYHGYWDRYRDDQYKNSFSSSTNFFVEQFYESYDIPYITRVDQFALKRNLEQENIVYEQFVKEHDRIYALVHEDPQRELSIHLNGLHKNIFNLNGASQVFFDWIKVIENAQEIHLIDSVWSAFIYQLDARYRIFENVPIYIYSLRGYEEMYQYPIALSNWKFK